MNRDWRSDLEEGRDSQRGGGRRSSSRDRRGVLGLEQKGQPSWPGLRGGRDSGRGEVSRSFSQRDRRGVSEWGQGDQDPGSDLEEESYSQTLGRWVSNINECSIM